MPWTKIQFRRPKNIKYPNHDDIENAINKFQKKGGSISKEKSNPQRNINQFKHKVRFF